MLRRKSDRSAHAQQKHCRRVFVHHKWLLCAHDCRSAMRHNVQQNCVQNSLCGSSWLKTYALSKPACGRAWDRTTSYGIVADHTVYASIQTHTCVSVLHNVVCKIALRISYTTAANHQDYVKLTQTTDIGAIFIFVIAYVSVSVQKPHGAALYGWLVPGKLASIISIRLRTVGHQARALHARLIYNNETT